MKLLTETYSLPAFWASYLVNGDATGLEDGDQEKINSWLKVHPWLGECLSVENEEEFCWDNYATGFVGSFVQFTFPVAVYEVVHYDSLHGGSYKRLIYPAQESEELLPWQKSGLLYTSTGYGSKIPTSKVIRMFGRKHRVYCRIYGNIGTCYIIYKGEEVVVS